MKAHFKQIPYDQFTPITAYLPFASKGSCILESSFEGNQTSFIGFDPISSISGRGDYVEALRKFKKQYPVEIDHPLALYTGSPIGYVTFENEYFFQVYRSAIIFDHQKKRAFISTFADPEKIFEKLYQTHLLPEEKIEISEVTSDKSDAQFMEMVDRAKEYLRAGDIYQIVLSRTFKAKMEREPFQFYRALRKTSPAPYLFFFDLGEKAMVGASPEKLISVKKGVVESMPIAGTVPKEESVETLLQSPKECIEHVMLVDLARNDLGAVCIPGSVEVSEFKKVRQFSHVTHLVSRVVGILRAELDALDAFKASFPAGTLSGAPKKRAMELISEMEEGPRGLYGGAIVALDSMGDLFSCIIIRTAIIQDGHLQLRAGAGIVLDSDPMKEALETHHKANTILQVANDLNYR